MADKKSAAAPAKTTAKAPAKATKAVTTARLRDQYNSKIAGELMTELALANAHQVPRIEKITLNVGLGKAKDEKRTIEAALNTLTKITGQKPVETIAKKSIASFKLREGNKIGLKVTLRGDKMYEFLDRFITIVYQKDC